MSESPSKISLTIKEYTHLFFQENEESLQLDATQKIFANPTISYQRRFSSNISAEQIQKGNFRGTTSLPENIEKATETLAWALFALEDFIYHNFNASNKEEEEHVHSSLSSGFPVIDLNKEEEDYYYSEYFYVTAETAAITRELLIAELYDSLKEKKNTEEGKAYFSQEKDDDKEVLPTRPLLQQAGKASYAYVFGYEPNKEKTIEQKVETIPVSDEEKGSNDKLYVFNFEENCHYFIALLPNPLPKEDKPNQLAKGGKSKFCDQLIAYLKKDDSVLKEENHGKTLPGFGIFTYFNGRLLQVNETTQGKTNNGEEKHQVPPPLAVVNPLAQLKRIKAALEEITTYLENAEYITSTGGIPNSSNVSSQDLLKKKKEKQSLDHILGELVLQRKGNHLKRDRKIILRNEMYAYKHLQTLRWLLGLYYVRLLSTGVAEIAKADENYNNKLKAVVDEKTEALLLAGDLYRLLGDNPWIYAELESEIEKVAEDEPSWAYRYLLPQFGNAKLFKRFYSIAVYLDKGKLGEKYISKLLDVAGVEKRDTIYWSEFTRILQNDREFDDLRAAFYRTKIYNVTVEPGSSGDTKTYDVWGTIEAASAVLAYVNLALLAYRAAESGEARDWVAFLGTATVMMLDKEAKKALSQFSAGTARTIDTIDTTAAKTLRKILKPSTLQKSAKFLGAGLDIGLAVWQLVHLKETDKDSQIASILSGFATGALVLLGTPVGWVVAVGIVGAIITELLRNTPLDNWIECTYAGTSPNAKDHVFVQAVGPKNWLKSYSNQIFGYEIMQHMPAKFKISLHRGNLIIEIDLPKNKNRKKYNLQIRSTVTLKKSGDIRPREGFHELKIDIARKKSALDNTHVIKEDVLKRTGFSLTELGFHDSFMLECSAELRYSPDSQPEIGRCIAHIVVAEGSVKRYI